MPGNSSSWRGTEEPPGRDSDGQTSWPRTSLFTPSIFITTHEIPELWHVRQQLCPRWLSTPPLHPRKHRSRSKHLTWQEQHGNPPTILRHRLVQVQNPSDTVAENSWISTKDIYSNCSVGTLEDQTRAGCGPCIVGTSGSVLGMWGRVDWKWESAPVSS